MMVKSTVVSLLNQSQDGQRVSAGLSWRFPSRPRDSLLASSPPTSIPALMRRPTASSYFLVSQSLQIGLHGKSSIQLLLTLMSVEACNFTFYYPIFSIDGAACPAKNALAIASRLAKHPPGHFTSAPTPSLSPRCDQDRDFSPRRLPRRGGGNVHAKATHPVRDRIREISIVASRSPSPDVASGGRSGSGSTATED